MWDKASQLQTLCRNCSSLNASEEISCSSKDCPIFYARAMAMNTMPKDFSEHDHTRTMLNLSLDGIYEDTDSRTSF